MEFVSVKYLIIVFLNEQQMLFLEFSGLRALTLRREETAYRRFEWIYDHLQKLVVHAGLFFVDRPFLKKKPIPSFAVPSNNYQETSQDRNPVHISIET